MTERPPLRLGFLASHGASGARAILEAARTGGLRAEGRLLISNNESAAAHDVAREYGLASLTLNARRCGGEEACDAAIAEALDAAGCDWIVLSGYMRLLGPQTLAAFPRRILNIHPALLPAFGGQGMYGDHVHRAVLAAGAARSGASVHLADAQYDHGAVLAQREAPVLPGDTLETLRECVRALEGPLLVETLAAIQAGRLDPGRLPPG